jgi:AcrR family transcriptional regulator
MNAFARENAGSVMLPGVTEIDTSTRLTMKTRLSTPPIRESLTRERIVATAITILESEGRNALSMRRLARALNVQAPSLYEHVDSKEELIIAILETALDDPDYVVNRDRPWEAELRRLMSELREHLLRHSWAAHLSQGNYPPALFRCGEAVQELLGDAGLTGEDAYKYRRLFSWTVWGFVSVETGLHGSRNYTPVDLEGRLGRAFRVHFPSDVRDAPQNLPSPHDVVDLDELFETSVDAFISGVRAAATAIGTNGGRGRRSKSAVRGKGDTLSPSNGE